MSEKSAFKITYQIRAESSREAKQKAEKLSLEQTVELPTDAVPGIAKSSIAQVLSLDEIDINTWIATLNFPAHIVGNDLTQFLNVLFGNSSLHHGIKIVDIEDDILNRIFNGPAFGIKGIRNRVGVTERALSCTALKPVGLNTSDLAERAYKFSRGGIDIIKDDHGITNQEVAPFRARVAACVRAVRKGEQYSGKKTLYFPNITTSPTRLIQRFEEAVELGADGVLLSPQLAGVESLHDLAIRNEVPIMAHPAFTGSFLIHPNQGILPEIYLGKIWRAFGADTIIYPNTGGRFSFKKETCHEINKQARRQMGTMNRSFPVPAGGIKRENVSDWVEEYGNDTIFLIGGSLYQHPEGIEKASSEFKQILEGYE